MDLDLETSCMVPMTTPVMTVTNANGVYEIALEEETCVMLQQQQQQQQQKQQQKQQQEGRLGQPNQPRRSGQVWNLFTLCTNCLLTLIMYTFKAISVL